MITPINQTQTSFRAKFYSHDLSILYNEAKRAQNPAKAKRELVGMLKQLEEIPEDIASLMYRTEYTNAKFNVKLGKTKAGASAISFTEALKNLFDKKGLTFKEYSEPIKDEEKMNLGFFKQFAKDA